MKGRIIPQSVRNKISEIHKRLGTNRGRKNGMFGKPTPHGKRIKYHNIYFRSTYEHIYAKYLDKNKIKWQYEPKTFDLGNCTYTPDFYLSKFDTYIEVKGWWRDDAKKKFKLFKKLYNKKIILITEKDLKCLNLL
jgi:predicted nuclease of restriction endonuclease-like RecB superfamily